MPPDQVFLETRNTSATRRDISLVRIENLPHGSSKTKPAPHLGMQGRSQVF